MNKTELKIQFEDISTFRAELFGWAIISIVVLHYFASVSVGTGAALLKYIAKAYNAFIGSVGVDIFVFLSGFGIYYSLKKGNSLSVFYKKRIVRVIIPYLAVGLIFWVIKDFLLQKESLLRYLYDLSLLSFWTEGVTTFWYIAFIVLMYILSPFIYRIIETKASFAIGLLLLCGLLFAAVYYFDPVYFGHVEIALLRMPQFILGMSAAQLAGKSVRIRGTAVVLLFFSPIIKLILNLCNSPFERLGNVFYSVLFIIIYVYFRKYIYKGKLDRIKYVGQYTLELYLTHISVRNVMGTIGLNLANPLIYAAHVVIFVLLIVLLVIFQNKCVNRVKYISVG